MFEMNIHLSSLNPYLTLLIGLTKANGLKTLVLLASMSFHTFHVKNITCVSFIPKCFATQVQCFTR